ncbi:MAG TPA: helix-turn-helix domain-containing protein [Candidatus Limivivens intestinipullorum]|uniref:Helix-turn-helix domain-containing protein n=1 Tax=Candidatus Limivivens intestinipullorum TaxID=2840858 RepID=A0A9D1EQW0_9FIRM|nr:helix-turn-helix domain-containing protein [Candidatus Limivivens intestinipullorum]
MKRIFRRLQYKYQLLATLLVVFFVPFLCISIFYISKIREAEQETYVAASQQLFQQSANGIGMIFEEINRLSYQFVNDKAFKSSNQSMLLSERMAVCDQIAQYVVNSQYIRELTFYSSADDTFYFSEGTSKPDLYYQRIYQYEDFDIDSFYSLLDTQEQPFGMLMQMRSMWSEEEPVLTVFVPLTGSYFDSVMFTVPFRQISSIEEELLQTPQDRMELYYNGKLLYSTDGEETAAGEAAIAAADQMESRIEDGRLIMEYYPENSLARIVLDKAMTGFDISIENISMFYFLALALFFLGGCVLVVLVWRESYRPIAEVMHYIPQEGGGKENEIDRVKKTLISIQSEQVKLNEELETSIPAYRKQLLTSLIKDEFNTLEEFNKQGESAGIYFRGNWLFILAIALVDSGQSEKIKKLPILEDILNYGEEHMPEKLTCYGFVDKMNEKIIYVGSSEAPEEAAQDQALLAFQSRIQEAFGFELTIGCSNWYERPENLGKAYMEALSALDYRIVFGYGKLIHFSQISLSNYSHSWYPDEQIRQFCIALKSRNEEQVHAVLDDIMGALYQNNTPVYVAKYVCYDLMRLLAESLTDSKTRPYKKTIGYHNIMNIARLTSFEQITEVLHQNVRLVLTEQGKEPDSGEGSEMRRQIEAFIEEHYGESSFSMSALADAFGVSESTMRKMFKSLIQTTFIEYLADKRIQKSKELLSSTKEPLNQIAGQVGYLDTSSFIRRFKQKTGMPPGEYRLLYGEKE